jgi:hypothetical protein
MLPRATELGSKMVAGGVGSLSRVCYRAVNADMTILELRDLAGCRLQGGCAPPLLLA